MKRAIIILAAAATVAACSKSEEAATLASDSVVTFTSNLATRVASTGTTSVWEYEDKIGITMTATSSEYKSTFENVPYISAVESGSTADKTTFSAVGDAITYPNSGSVNFYAYYPYDEDLANGVTTLDVTGQSTDGLSSKDLMIASNTGVAVGASAVALEFDHKMAKLSFTLSKGENIESLEGLTASFTGHSTSGSLAIETGIISVATASTGEIDMYVTEGADSYTAEAIIYPETATTAVVFTLNGRSFGTTIASTTFAENKIYSYTMTIGNDYVDFDGECKINSWVSAGEAEYSPTEEVNDLAYNGTEFEINSAAGLFAFADLVNGGDGTYSTATVTWGESGITAFSTSKQLSIDGKLTKDIELNSVEWTAIGSSSGSYKGTFDGGGYLV
ncbi:MAG: fimbrillin family protein, partial [Rikenellaceae bacterium]